jgi:hypothetical protein
VAAKASSSPFVLLAHPILGGGLRLMADEFAIEAPGKALIKQDAHGRGAPPWLAPGPLRPAPW